MSRRITACLFFVSWLALPFPQIAAANELLRLGKEGNSRENMVAIINYAQNCEHKHLADEMRELELDIANYPFLSPNYWLTRGLFSPKSAQKNIMDYVLLAYDVIEASAKQNN